MASRLREAHRLKVTENKLLKRICGPEAKIDKTT
jgi:hypothetical protein